MKAQADYMATALARFGWKYVVVDLRWYELEATGAANGQAAAVAIDAHGRLLPAPDRFPSCAAGFRPLADHVHSLGLELGLHVLRGIPRAAVESNLPILGSSLTARDIADLNDTCPWNPDMYGVDMSRPGAQAYYDSVFAAFAAWGVDYVQVDDLGRRYHARQAEVEGIRRAIDRSGRSMVLSLASGPTPLSAAEHVVQHANLWRIGDDVGDDWDDVRAQFARLRDWNEQRGPGRWPDADTLPLGVLDLDRRMTRLSPDEQRTLLTLWAVARSPLMHGGDMTQMDDWTLSLLTNPELIALNQDSRDNRPLFDDAGLIAWLATSGSGRERYLALFNTRDRTPRSDQHVLFSASLDGGPRAFQTTLVDVPVVPGTLLHLLADDGHGGHGDPQAIVWGEPVLEGPAGEISILDLPWERGTSRSGSVTLQRSASEGGLLLGGRPLDRGVLVHTKSEIAFRVPPGYDRLVVECGFEGATLPSIERAEGMVARCVIRGETLEPRETHPQKPRPLEAQPHESNHDFGLPMTVSLADLGLEGGHDGGDNAVLVRDVWAGEDLGSFETVFTRAIPWHGAGLFRVSFPSS